MPEFCKDCGWDVESHGHYRECTQPKAEAEEHNRVVAIERENESLKLQIEAWTKELRMAVNANCSCGGRGPMDEGVCMFCLLWHRTAGKSEA